MTKQKVVIKVSMNGKKSRSKALKIAVGVSGVEGAALKGKERDEIEVTGEEIDSVVLTLMLRKSFGHADLLSVGPVEDLKEKENKEEDQIVWSYLSGGVLSQNPNFEIRSVSQYHDPYCSIM